MSPTEPSPADEGDIRSQLARAGRIAVEQGLVVASGGNLSARIGGTDRSAGDLVVTKSGTWLDRLDDDSFVRIPIDAEQAPAGSNPSVEWRLHQFTYRRRPDVEAIVHLHPQRLVLLDAAGLPIRLITTDHCLYLREVGTVDYHRPGTEALAEAAADTAADHDVMILRRHGCSTLGADVDMALRRALNLGEAGDLTFDSHLLGCDHGIEMPTADRLELDQA